MANNSVSVAELSIDAVTTVKIADNAVTSIKINDITSVHGATENTPMFKISKSGNQSIATNTWTEVTFDVDKVTHDPLGHWSTSNSRYTPNGHNVGITSSLMLLSR